MEKDLPFEGLIFDMDGVVTQTAKVHAKAWKVMLDNFLKSYQGLDFRPFDDFSEYRTYIDGKPRLDGIRSFLKSRNITLEEGSFKDPETSHTVHGLGKSKNRLFLDIIDKEGVQTYPDTLAFIRRWKDQKKIALISASKNTRYILETAGLLDSFEVRIDGVVAEKKHLKGKPAPDIFLEASTQLGLNPSQCIVFEDAIAGVQAGQKGRFGLVVGLARDGGAEELRHNGADFVVNSLENVEEKIKRHV